MRDPLHQGSHLLLSIIPTNYKSGIGTTELSKSKISEIALVSRVLATNKRADIREETEPAISSNRRGNYYRYQGFTVIAW